MKTAGQQARGKVGREACRTAGWQANILTVQQAGSKQAGRQGGYQARSLAGKQDGRPAMWLASKPAGLHKCGLSWHGAGRRAIC
jgi:hypothetical protein